MALALLSALLIFVALPPYDLWPLGWIALIPLLLAIHKVGPKEAFFLGALAGTVANYLAFRWCLELMNRFSKLGPLAYLVMLLMSLYQCLPWALWCGALRLPVRSRGKMNSLLALLLAGCSLVTLEFFYPIIFPWYLANSQHSRPEVVSPVELGGVSLLSLLMVVFALLFTAFLVQGEDAEGAPVWPIPWTYRRGWLLLCAVVTLGLPWLTHSLLRERVEVALSQAPKLAVGLVQPNEWIGSHPSIQGLHAYQQMTEQLVQECAARGESLDLVMWPESAVRTPPGTIERLPAGASDPILDQSGRLLRYPLDVSRILPSFTKPAASLVEEGAVDQADLLALQRGHSVPILFGTTLEDVNPEAKGPIPGRAPLYNCGVLIDGAGNVLGAVKKVKLLIFGETIPGSAYFPWIYQLLPSASALLPGTDAEIITLGQARLGIMVCYEDLLPWFHHELAQKSPHILLNLTNDAWFGKTAEPACHLALSTLRAVEGRCYLIRSTPSGVSAVVDPWGQIVAAIPSDQAGTLRHEVSLLEVTTLFERWGDWVAWLSLLVMLSLGSYSWARGPRSASAS